MLNTIKSRCTKVYFNKLNNDEIMEIFQKKNDIGDISKNILLASEGSIGKAIQIKENIDVYNNVDDIIRNIKNDNIIDLMKKAELLYESKNNILEILNYMNIILFQRMKDDYLNNKKYIKCIGIIEETKKKIKCNANYDMSIDFLLFKLWEELNN